MGSLKPGATYIYEHADGVTYAREFGADPNTRITIGYTYDPITGHPLPEGERDLTAHMEWNEIRRLAKTNPTLQKAVENVILIYRMVKDDVREIND